MTALTLAQLENLFQEVTVSITGLTGDKVRIAPQQASQPAWTISQDVVFININPVDDAYDKLRDYVYDEYDADNAIQSVFYTRVIECYWSVYGPNSYENADLIRNGILLEAARWVLADALVYPLTAIAAPMRANYNFNGQFWERSDLRARFNVGTLRSAIVPYFDGANIEIWDDHGLERVIEVSES